MPNRPWSISRSVPQTPTSSTLQRHLSRRRRPGRPPRRSASSTALRAQLTSACIGSAAVSVDVAIASSAGARRGAALGRATRPPAVGRHRGPALHVSDRCGDDRALAARRPGRRRGADRPASRRCSSRSPTGWRARRSRGRARCETLVPFPHGAGAALNDGACDADGPLLDRHASARRSHRAPAALYRYDGGALVTVLAGVTLSNGIGWSPDGARMYYVDSLDPPDRRRSTSTARPGATAARSSAIAGGDGIPDGLAVDDEGGVWVALLGGGARAALRRRTARSTTRSRSRPEGDRVLLRRRRRPARCSSRRPRRTVACSSPGPGVSGPPASRSRLSTAPSDAEPTSAR